MSIYSPVQAGFGSPLRQSRWTVAFRLILAIPLVIWLALLSIAAGFLILVGWFAALVLGRLPKSFVRPLSDYVVFVTRVYSYIYLLNDDYPPFSASRDFVVNLEIPSSKVRRLAVLFRIILLIPTAIVSVVIAVGVEVCLVFIWLIVLVKGEMPLSLFGALAAVLRYQARFYAYYMMITSKYPGELFGDAPSNPLDSSAPLGDALPTDPAATDVPVHPAVDVTAPYGLPVESVTSSPGDRVSESTLSPGAPSGPPTDFGASGSPSDFGEPPRTARLVLSQGSKIILVTFLILGVVGWAAQITLEGRLLGNESALSRLSIANNLLNGEVAAAKAQKTSCSLGTNTCVQQYFSTVASDFLMFQFTLDGTNFPSGTEADAQRFEGVTNKFVNLLGHLGSGSSITQTELTQLTTLGNTWDSDFNQVISDLSSPI